MTREDAFKARRQREILDEWPKWTREIPAIPMRDGWSIRPIPPYMGAVSRFIVVAGGHEVSVYLDCYSVLGSVETPYWEVYPVGDDTGRCAMSDVDELVKLIERSIKGEKR